MIFGSNCGEGIKVFDGGYDGCKQWIPIFYRNI